MYLSSLSLTSFRSYMRAEFEFAPDLTLIIGPNTAGKTNVLEAIVLLATGRSFSEHSGQHLIRNGDNHFCLEAVIEEDSSATKQIGVNAVYDSDDSSRVRKKFVVEGVGKRRDQFASNFQVVYFGPEEIRLVLGAPSRRRDFLDSVLSALDPMYAQENLRYRRLRLQRNNLLRAMNKGASHGSDWLLWTEELIGLGNVITRKRKSLLAKLNKTLSSNSYGTLKNLELKYSNDELSLDLFRKVRRKEIERGTTILGPHRDDIQFTCRDEQADGTVRDLAAYGSRGEQRLAVTALKLSELELRTEISGQRPILLLDDVFSELDAGNRADILEVIPRQQTIVTTTNPQIASQYFPTRPCIINL